MLQIHVSYKAVNQLKYTETSKLNPKMLTLNSKKCFAFNLSHKVFTETC